MEEVREYGKKSQPKIRYSQFDAEDIRKELLDLVQEEQFSSKFFPDYVILKESLEQERHNIEIYKDKQQRFRNWYKEVEAINLECRTLN